ncbi:MAG: hypothetical protein LAT68_03505 [Cyclobacteriaceae bacterium]|nr:hypothetical protein [Cyclobacteriaceae bacterium]MCH8515375.1 hypothetical protein [Cyclobacteriaceae bacterium]
MSRNRKLFLIGAGIFCLILGIIVYDMIQKTTFPKRGGNNTVDEIKKEETLQNMPEKGDSIQNSQE